MAANGPAASAATQGDRMRFMRFAVSGGIAAGVNVLARWLLNHIVSYELAIGVAYLIGMTTAYFLTAFFVFERSGGSAMSEYGRFAIVNAISFMVVLAVSEILARILFPAIGLTWHAGDLAHLIGVASPILLSYYAHKHFSFSGR